jgi:phospholipase C
VNQGVAPRRHRWAAVPRWKRPARPGDRPDPSRPPGTDTLPQIKHIVILMMENHSFDNYLGTLGRGEGFSLGDDGTPDAENPDSAGTMIRSYHASSTVQPDGVPCQSWSGTICAPSAVRCCPR